MSFFDEIKTEIQTEQNQKSNLAEQVSAAQAPQAASEPAPTAPVLPERMPEFVQEELKALQETIRQDARSGKYQTVGGKHLFGKCHTHGIGDSLSEGTGGCFDPGNDAVLRVPRRTALKLAKCLDILNRKVVTG